MEHARLDRVIKQLEQLANLPSESGERPPRIVVKRLGRPPGSKNKRREEPVLQDA